MSEVMAEREIDRSQMKVSDEVAVEISGMNKWYGAFHVLRDINLTVNRGERIVIAGPSGSGKSTLIRCINALEEHQQGKIVVDGTVLSNDLKNIDKIRSEVGNSIDCEVKRIGSGAEAASATMGDSMRAAMRAAGRIGFMAVLLKRPGMTRPRCRSA